MTQNTEIRELGAAGTLLEVIERIAASYDQWLAQPPAQRSALGWLKADDCLQALLSYRALRSELEAREPAYGLRCVVTRATLQGLAQGNAQALRLIDSLEPAPCYRVRLEELLGLERLLRSEPEVPAGAAPAVAAPPPSVLNADNPPLAGVAPFAPPQFAGSPAPVGQPPPPPASPAFVPSTGLAGLTDDEIVDMVTRNAQTAPAQAASAPTQPPPAPTGSSLHQPQQPGALPVQHPFVPQARDPQTGLAGGTAPRGPSPQELQRMRRRIEGGEA